MKTRFFSLPSISMILAGFALAGCSLDPHSKFAKITIEIENHHEEISFSGSSDSRNRTTSETDWVNANHESEPLPPETVDQMDCLAVNVMSERIPSAIFEPQYQSDRYPSIFKEKNCVYAGITSAFFDPRDSRIVADLVMPAGPSVFTILGFKSRSDTRCPIGYPAGKFFEETKNDQGVDFKVYLVGRTTANVSKDSTIVIENQYSPTTATDDQTRYCADLFKTEAPRTSSSPSPSPSPSASANPTASPSPSPSPSP